MRATSAPDGSAGGRFFPPPFSAALFLPGYSGAGGRFLPRPRRMARRVANFRHRRFRRRCFRCAFLTWVANFRHGRDHDQSYRGSPPSASLPACRPPPPCAPRPRRKARRAAHLCHRRFRRHCFCRGIPARVAHLCQGRAGWLGGCATWRIRVFCRLVFFRAFGVRCVIWRSVTADRRFPNPHHPRQRAVADGLARFVGGGGRGEQVEAADGQCQIRQFAGFGNNQLFATGWPCRVPSRRDVGLPPRDKGGRASCCAG